MSEQFKPITLGKLLRIKHGYPFLGEFFADEGEFIVLTPGNFYDVGGFKRIPGKEKYYLGTFPDEYVCSEGDLVVAMTQQAEGLLGSTAIIPESGVYLHNQRIGLIIHDEKQADKMFLYYLFMTSGVRKQIRATASGSKVKHTSPERIYDVKVWIPGVPEQNDIANVLDKIERKINLNNAINTELEKTAKLLYDYWFVQFDFPNAESKPYRTSGGEMVWNEQLKREVPKGWKVCPLPKECTIIDCLHSSKPDLVFEDEDYYLLQLENLVEHGIVNLSNKYYVTKDMYDLWTSRIEVEEGDLVITNAGRIGSVARIPHNVRAGIGRNMTAVRPQNTPPCFLYYFITGIDAAGQIKLNTDTGSFFGSLNVRGIKELLLTLPPLSTRKILDDFEKHVYPLRRKIEICAQENQELTALRDFLLPLLMNGQVHVAAAEAAVEAMATAEEQPAVVKEPSKREAVFKRLVLSAYILDNICDEPTAGRVKFEKLLYLSEHCAQLSLHSEFHRAAAGPYDSKSLYSIENQLNQNKWFKRQKITGESRAYIRLAKINGYRQYVGTNFNAAQKSVIDKLISLFKTARTIQCEIVATLYGAWNDFLLDGIQPSDTQIVDEVLTNWHEKKERISRTRWLNALEWMRSNEIVPVGYGVSTKGFK